VRAVIVAVLCAGALAASGATGGGPPAGAATAAAGPTASHRDDPPNGPGQTYTFTLRYGGRSRTFLLHVPPQEAAGRPLPLVLNLHGASSTAIEEEGYTDMDPAADRDGFLVAYPNGTPLTPGATNSDGWDAGLCCRLPATSHVDDVGFLLAVIADVARHDPVDPSRVYVTGYSNGGMMAYAMAAEAAGHIAAVASVDGQVELAHIHPSRPVPVLEFHSVTDPAAKWGGIPGPPGGGWDILPVLSGIDQWLGADRCLRRRVSTGPTVHGTGTLDAGESLTVLRWSHCAGGSEVELYEFTGSGHVWPGSPLDLTGVEIFGTSLGRSTDLVTANQVIWRFFSAYHLPRRP
jgi:polyhydroxybutyrate depolymerase